MAVRIHGQAESEVMLNTTDRAGRVWRLVRAVLPCITVFALSTSASARFQTGDHTPRSFKLQQFCRHLYEPKRQEVLQIIGDSINATNGATSMQVAYRDLFEVPFNGWVVHADNGNSDIGYTNSQGPRAIDQVRNPGDTFSSGVSGISPVRARDTVWRADVKPSYNLSDSYILNDNLSAMKRGNPFASPAMVDLRLIMYEGANQVPGFEVAGMRALSTISTGTYLCPLEPAGAIVWLDRTAGASVADPGVRLRSSSATNESLLGANTLIHLGSRFRAQTISGVQMQFMAHGGWTAVDHVDPAKFTDAALAQYYAATDPPTHIIIWLGQNQTLEESNNFAIGSYQLFMADIAAIIDRHERVIADLGAPAPRWLLVSQYKTGYSDEYNLMMCHALYDLAIERPNVSYLDMYQIAGGAGFDTDAFLTDGVHPSPAGAAFLGELMNGEMRAAACPADFDQSGFVDMVDFDSFIQAFESGSDSADINESGFVDVEDFTYFVARFEAGC